MKIKQYFSKERFSMGQVVGLLAVIFIGITVLAYAAVNIPYTFTSGTTAKASEVNANFQALANSMPAVKTTYVATAENITSTTGVQIHSIQVTSPSTGNVIISASGTVCIFNHTNGNTDNVMLKVSTISGDVSTSSYEGLTAFTEPNTYPSHFQNACVPFTIVRVFPASTSATTYYLNARVNSGITGGAYATLIAQYVPNTLN
ncbi:MAG: hypothetical protein QMD01_07050 [Thermodesulfovibrionales bacterium]|nr:hypothetical protein [Thermodesulfovibrionales bacterium]